MSARSKALHTFFDSSAFVKRYISEEGSSEILSLCDRSTSISLSAIALPELISVFCRLRREGRLSGERYQGLKSALLADIEDVYISELTPQAVLRSMGCLEASALRAMDAIHLGCAIDAHADLFVTADRRQYQAAKDAGLKALLA